MARFVRKKKKSWKKYKPYVMPAILLVVLSVTLSAVFSKQLFEFRSRADMMMGGNIDNCKINNVNSTDMMAFCDLFVLPAQAPYRGRSGDLDIRRWSYSRVTEDTNPAQGLIDPVLTANAQFCKIKKTVNADNDSFFCGLEFGEPNHWMSVINDQSYSADAAEITQPFDFAGRTGVISFDVDAHTLGEHDIWPEAWITDEPVQDPHLDHTGTHSYPRNGVAFVINNNCDDLGKSAALRSIDVFTNYIDHEVYNSTNNDPVCFTTAPDNANHFEIHISQSRIEFWGSDAGGENFRLLASKAVTVPFNRGYVHFEHAEYNPAKFGPTDTGTFHWHALGFDGPVIPADRTYQVPDSLTKTSGGVNVGYVSPLSYTFSNVDLSNVKKAYITLSVEYFGNPQALNYTINGVQRSWTDDKPASAQPNTQWGYAVVPLSLSDLKQGTNTVTITGLGCDSGFCDTFANVDLDLQLNDTAPFTKFVNPPVPCVTPYPGYTAAPCGDMGSTTSTSGTMPTDTMAMMPTDTPIPTMFNPTSTPTVFVPTSTPRPTSVPTPTTFIPTPTLNSTGTVTFGFTSKGAYLDGGDANNINGTRFKTGAIGGTVQSISVFVGGVNAAPNNQYQVALYADNNGKPGGLIASSGTGTLIGNSWNTIPITAPINANTAYWLFYNTNASSDANNMRLSAGTSTQGYWVTVGFGTWPANLSSWGGNFGNWKFSIYGTYK